MTFLLEVKQKIKSIYAHSEFVLLPIIKALLAFGFFSWITQTTGFMTQLNSMFILLILSLICCLLPGAMTVFIGMLLILGHAYALSWEAAVFLLVLFIFMVILFLRFSAGTNAILALSPLAFSFNVPVLLPIGCGLLSSAASIFPAGCGVILYYFLRFLGSADCVAMLRNPEVQMLDKAIFLADNLMQNWGMWLHVISVVVVILLVNLIRTRSFDYAWRISIILGGISYVLLIIGGGYYLDIKVYMVPLLVYTLAAVVLGLIVEFFVFGGDYSRVERLSYDDDDYYYYVKAVPKATVSSSERSIKKINAEPLQEEKKKEEKALTYANPIFRGPEQQNVAQTTQEVPLLKKHEVEEVDFEKKLEESLKDL